MVELPLAHGRLNPVTHVTWQPTPLTRTLPSRFSPGYFLYSPSFLSPTSSPPTVRVGSENIMSHCQ